MGSHIKVQHNHWNKLLNLYSNTNSLRMVKLTLFINLLVLHHLALFVSKDQVLTMDQLRLPPNSYGGE
jgi:hypothetical protein